MQRNVAPWDRFNRFGLTTCVHSITAVKSKACQSKSAEGKAHSGGVWLFSVTELPSYGGTATHSRPASSCHNSRSHAAHLLYTHHLACASPLPPFKVPLHSIEFHSQRHHFSNWLFARGEFGLAHYLRGVDVSQFADADALRRFLIDAFKRSALELNPFPFSGPIHSWSNLLPA